MSLIIRVSSICLVPGKKLSKPLDGRTVFLDLVGRSNYVDVEKKLQLLGAVCIVCCFFTFDGIALCLVKIIKLLQLID